MNESLNARQDLARLGYADIDEASLRLLDVIAKRYGQRMGGVLVLDPTAFPQQARDIQALIAATPTIAKVIERIRDSGLGADFENLIRQLSPSPDPRKVAIHNLGSSPVQTTEGLTVVDTWNGLQSHGRFVHQDLATGGPEALQIKHCHGDASDVPLLARDLQYLKAFVQHQDAATAAAMNAIEMYGSHRTAVILEMFYPEFLTLGATQRADLTNVAEMDKKRSSLSMEYLRQFFSQPDKKLTRRGFNCLVAQTRVAAQCLVRGYPECVYAGRPEKTESKPSAYLNKNLDTFIRAWPSLPSESDVRTMLQHFETLMMADRTRRHAFTVAQAQRARDEGRDRIIVMFGGEHTNHGSCLRTFSNPLDADLSAGAFRTTVFEPNAYPNVVSHFAHDPTFLDAGNLTTESIFTLLRLKKGRVE